LRDNQSVERLILKANVKCETLNVKLQLMSIHIAVEPFGEWQGKAINQYNIVSDNGMSVSIINYGAIITQLLVPTANNQRKDVVFGFTSMEGYIHAGKHYIGAICGRYANRISKGEITVDGNKYQISKNNGGNSLHGGTIGFDKKYWNAEIIHDAVRFSYFSPDGEEGFPGNLQVAVTFRLSDKQLHLEYSATCDQATTINLTNHSYFNLSGDDTILDHQLQIDADTIVEVNDELIPTGMMVPVAGTNLDFRRSRKIKDQNKTVEYDYSWVLNKRRGELKAAAKLTCPVGLRMTVYTTQPAVHFYSGNFLDANFIETKENKVYSKFGALCLETQHFPDSPNHKNFPDTILRPGEKYNQKTIFSFDHP
jgi:aldose 1-epimerase